MIVVVTGSRELTKHPLRLTIKDLFVDTIAAQSPDHVYHGGAIGPDLWAWQAFMDIQRCFRPEPEDRLTPAQQLLKRNCTMIEAALNADDEVVMVACWDGQSNGTRHAMNYTRDLGTKIIQIGLP